MEFVSIYMDYNGKSYREFVMTLRSMPKTSHILGFLMRVLPLTSTVTSRRRSQVFPLHPPCWIWVPWPRGHVLEYLIQFNLDLPSLTTDVVSAFP